MNERTHVALLRGINVGGNNKINMKELAALFERLGFTNVKTYINSGNVVFTAKGKPERLQETIAKGIEAAFALTIPVVVLDRAELEAAIASNPYPEAEATYKQLYLVFLSHLPHAEYLQQLNPTQFQPDRFSILNRAIYIHFMGKVSDSKFTNQYFDSRLKCVTTGRNWQTVQKIAELLKHPEVSRR